MKIHKSKNYEELAVEWQYELILLLKQALKENKVKTNIAKEIIEDFVFNLSMLHDQGEIKLNGKSYNPRICFDDFDGTLIINDDETNLHDYALGNVSEIFGE